jgi:large subunit ribosomal protein L25
MIRLRAAGKIPAVVCERGKPSLSVTVPNQAFRTLLGASAHLVELKIGGKAEKVLIKSVQWDPLGEDVVHVDFQKVDLTQRVEVEVAVVLKGKPVGVSEEGGQLTAHERSLTVRCLPAAIPGHIVVDVSALKLNDVLHATAVKLPGGVELASPPDTVLATVDPPRAEEEAAAPAEPAAPGALEPEVIAKGKKEEEGEAAATEEE